MLKSNSLQARENVVNYIMESLDAKRFGSNVKKAKRHILKAYRAESVCAYHPYNRNNFKDWAKGLPSSCDALFDYYYNVDSRTILMRVLDESEEDAMKYEREKADSFLTTLIWNECHKKDTL